MDFLSEHQTAQQSGALICHKHQEAIEGICLFDGPCSERFLCNTCKNSHENNHLDNYDELENLLKGYLVDNTLNSFKLLLKKIDHQIMAHKKETQLALAEIDNIQEHMMQKLDETRNLFLQRNSEKIQAKNDIKSTIIFEMNEIEAQFNGTQNFHYQPLFIVDQLLTAIIKSQSTKATIITDPNFNTQSNFEINFLLKEASTHLFESMDIFQDKINAVIKNNLHTLATLSSRSKPSDAHSVRFVDNSKSIFKNIFHQQRSQHEYQSIVEERSQFQLLNLGSHYHQDTHEINQSIQLNMEEEKKPQKTILSSCRIEKERQEYLERENNIDAELKKLQNYSKRNKLTSYNGRRICNIIGGKIWEMD